MSRLTILAGVVCCLLLAACGGGSGTNYSVSFSVKDGDTELGPGSFRTLVATVNGPEGEPADGIDVSFSMHQNQSDATLQKINSKTNADGTAEAIYQAGQNPGTDIIQVKARDSKASISFSIAGGGEDVSTVILSAAQDQVDIGGYSDITVEGLTYDDQPAADSQVEFSFQVNNSGAAFIQDGQEVQSITETLDTNGQAQVTYRAGSSSGYDVIQVSFPQAVEARDSISITVGQGKALGQIKLEAFKSTEPAEWTIQAEVRDQDGNLAPNVLVNFNVDNGNLSSSTQTTNENGLAEVTLTDSFWATIYAQVENVEHEVEVSVDEYFEAGSVELVAPQEVAGDSVQVRALVKDQDNQRLIDIPVQFHADRGTLDPANAQTDTYGEATTTLQVQESGRVRVWASVGNVSVSDVMNIDIQVEKPAFLDLDAPSTSKSETVSIQASVRNEQGQPIPEYPVTFFADKGSLASNNVTTDANGIASTELTMQKAETVRITATAGAISQTQNISFELPEEP
ncbi:MAG: Ig-like domain-containing protein [Desulfohalobiaceae bacterium]